MAIACLRLLTFLPLRPDLSSPRFISCIARSTLRPAFLPYLRPELFLRAPVLDFLRPPVLDFLRPRVLVFDEAAANLDAPTAERFAQTVNQLRGKVTIVRGLKP